MKLYKLIDISFFLSVIAIIALSEEADTIFLSRLLIFQFFGVSFIYMLNSNRVIFPKYIIILLLFVIISLINSLFNGIYDSTILRITTIIQLIAYAFFVSNYLIHENKLHNGLKIFMYGTIISILYRLFRGGLQELIKVFSGVNILHVDMLGLIVGANIFSIALIVSFFISIYYYIVSKNKLYILYSILFFAMMILSGSRKVYLSLFIVVLWFLITNFRKIKPRTILFVVLISALGFIFLVSSDLFSYSINRFRGFINLFIGGEDVDISTLVRIEMIQEGFSAFSRRPLVGYGFGYIEEILTPRFLGFSSYLHNNYIELLVSVGLLGFICFYYMYFSFFKKLRKINEISKPLYLIFIIVLLSTDLAMATYRLKITFLIIPFIDSYIRINLKNKRKEVA